MTISLLNVISDAQRSDLVDKLLHTGVSKEKAGLAIDTLIPIAVSHLVAINKDQGTDVALSHLSQDSVDANWASLDRAAVGSQLAASVGLNAAQAETAISSVINATKTEVTGLLAHHSLHDLLIAQHGFLATAAAALAGVTGLAGGLFGSAVDTVSDVAGKAGDAVKDVAGGAVNLAGNAVDKVGDLFSGAAGAVSNVAGGAVDLAGDAAKGVANAVGNVADGAVGLAGAAVDKTSDVVKGAAGAVSNVAGSAVDLAGDAAKGVANAVGNVADGAVDLAGAAVDKASDALKGVAGAAGNLVGGAAHGLKDGAAGIAGGVAAAGAGLAAGASNVAKGGTSLFRKLLPFLALAVLALLLVAFYKKCSHQQPAPVAPSTTETTPVAPATPITLTAPTLKLATGADGSLASCAATIGTEEAKASLLAKIKAAFGDAANCDIKVDATYGVTLPNDEQLAQALSAVKASPNTSLDLNGTAITLDGSTAAGLKALSEKLTQLLGAGYTVVTAAPLDVAAKVADSTNAAINAIKALVPGQTSAQQIADALNLQIINFASGKADIPTEAQEVLKEASALLKQVPDARLAVTGYTDNVGDEAANVKLSQARANAVSAFLLKNGATPEQLATKGVGSASPKADNVTESGRFANRRIEFTVNDGLDPALSTAK